MEEKKWVRTAIEARRRLGTGGDDLSRLGDRGPRFWTRPSGKGRLAKIHAIARDLGISGPTLRNYLIALADLEAIRDDKMARLLSQHSAVAVTAFCRWVRRESWSAEEFLRANPRAPLAQLLAAERAQRMHGKQRDGARPRPELNDALISRLSPGPRFLTALGRHSEVRLGPDTVLVEIVPAPYKFAGLDRLITPSGGPDPEKMAPMNVPGAITLPRLAVLDDYAKRSREIWWRASSASALCPLVLVVFPGPAARRRFLGALPSPQGPGKDIFAGLPQAPKSGTGSASRPLFFRTGAGHGLIVITSTLTLERDISS
ncbi:hypothetical protein [Devosia sp. CAU 1758]